MLSHEDLAHVEALWQEWTSGLPYDLTVLIVGEHSETMDLDRPVGAIVKARLSLRIRIHTDGSLIFDETCPYDAEALRTSVQLLARTIAKAT